MSVTALEALEKRRTIRNYDPDWKIPKEQLDKIMHEAVIFPTTNDFQQQDFLLFQTKKN